MLGSSRLRTALLLIAAVSLLAACAPQAVATPAAGASPAAATPQPSSGEPATPSEIRIGVVLPLTGPSSTSGLNAKTGVEVAEAIINGEYPELAKLAFPMADKAGLPSLGGAKVKFVFGDDQGVPEKSLSETERMITAEKAVMVMGGFSSACAATGSQVSERIGVPYIAPNATSPRLTTERGYKWFFRLSPHDDTLAKNSVEFIRDMNDKYGAKVTTIATLYENTLFGSDNSTALNKWAGEFGIKVVANVPYPASTTDLTSEIQTLKQAKPQVVLPASYVADALLTMRTVKSLDFNVDGIVAQDTGYVDSTFLPTLGADGDYLISRDMFSLDLAIKKPAVKILNEQMYKPKRGMDMDSVSARYITAALLAADVVNRAGSVKPDALQKALQETNWNCDALPVPWAGIKFDETGHNVLGNTLFLQAKNGRWWTIWPFGLSVVGTPDCPLKDVVWPMPKWSERQ